MRAKLIMVYTKLSHAAFLNRLNNIASCAKNTKYFPAKRPAGVATAASLASLATQYAAACVAAESGDKTAIAARNALRTQIEAVLKALAHYYEMLANGNQEALQTTGFDLQRQSVKSTVLTAPPAPEGMTVECGTASGTAIIRASLVEGATHYQGQFTALNAQVEANWGGTVDSETCARIFFTDLIPTSRLSFRLRAFRKGKWSSWVQSTPLVIA